MKNIALLLSLVFVLSAFGQSAPPQSKGQQDSGYMVPKPNLQVPNKLATNLGGLDVLLETGNNNILANPSFEHSTFSTSWTNSAGTPSAESTIVVHGKKSYKLVLSAQTMALIQDSTLYAAQFADGVQGLAMVRIKSDIALSVCSRQAGTTSTTNCVTTASDSKWGLYKIPFILGATSNGISIASSGSVSGTVYIDDGFVGAVDLKQDVPTPKIGIVTSAAAASCQWSMTGTTKSAFTADTDCVTATAYGIASAPATKIPAIVLPTGAGPVLDFTISANFHAQRAAATGAICTFELYDGTNSYPLNTVRINGASGTIVNRVPVMRASVVLSSPLVASTTYQIRAVGDSASTLCDLENDDATNGGQFQIEVVSMANTSVYTAQSSDTGWASCGHTTSDFTGFGTVTNIETQCKRDKSDLLMRGKFTVGTPTATEARLALKLNGVALTSASSTYIPTIQTSGVYFRNAAGGATAVHGGATLQEPAVAYMTFGGSNQFGNVSENFIAKSTGSGLATASDVIGLTGVRIHISGWDNSNQIIGTFAEVRTTPGVTKPIGFGFRSSASCTTGSCAGTFKGTTLSAGNVTFSSTGTYAVAIPAGKCSSTPFCDGSVNAFASFSNKCTVQPVSSTSLTVNCTNTAGSSVNEGFQFNCECDSP